jgi:hypothetical protein
VASGLKKPSPQIRPVVGAGTGASDSKEPKADEISKKKE